MLNNWIYSTNVGTLLALDGKTPRQALAGMRLSYRQLSRYFQEEYALSPQEFMKNRRMHEAAQLLKDTDRFVTAIAFELGFHSSQYFAKSFRDYFEVSPSQFRRLIRQKEIRGLPEAAQSICMMKERGLML